MNIEELKSYLEENLYVENLKGFTKCEIRDKAIENLLDYFKYNLEEIYKISNLTAIGIVEDLAEYNMDVLKFKEI